MTLDLYVSPYYYDTMHVHIYVIKNELTSKSNIIIGVKFCAHMLGLLMLSQYHGILY